MIVLSNLSVEVRQILAGNVWIVVCCVFYLMWWLMAFKPSGAVTGMKTDWLLLPALAAGAIGVLMALQGIYRISPEPNSYLFPGGAILIGGVVAYAVLLVVTLVIFKRPVTTELFLIVGWGMLALSEVNALYASGVFSHNLAIVFVAIVFAAIVASLICYILYYKLKSGSGYIDGMIPLMIVIAITISLSCFIVLPGR